jgi:hypothetical protein
MHTGSVLTVLLMIAMLGLAVSVRAEGDPTPPAEKDKQALAIRREITYRPNTRERAFLVIQSGTGKDADGGVDFTKETILVAAMGTRRTGGYRISIDAVYQLPDRVQVLVMESSPGPDQMVTMAFTWPCDVVAIPKVTRPVFFIVTSVVGRTKQGKAITLYPILQSITGETGENTPARSQVVRSEEDWKKLWPTLSEEERPAVDFAKQMALVIVAGTQPTPRRVVVTQVSESGDKITVTYRLDDLDIPAVIGAKTTVNPFVVVIVPAGSNEVAFTMTTGKDDGGGKIRPAPIREK